MLVVDRWLAMLVIVCWLIDVYARLLVVGCWLLGIDTVLCINCCLQRRLTLVVGCVLRCVYCCALTVDRCLLTADC